MKIFSEPREAASIPELVVVLEAIWQGAKVWNFRLLNLACRPNNHRMAQVFQTTRGPILVPDVDKRGDYGPDVFLPPWRDPTEPIAVEILDEPVVGGLPVLDVHCSCRRAYVHADRVHEWLIAKRRRVLLPEQLGRHALDCSASTRRR